MSNPTAKPPDATNPGWRTLALLLTWVLVLAALFVLLQPAMQGPSALEGLRP